MDLAPLKFKIEIAIKEPSLERVIIVKPGIIVGNQRRGGLLRQFRGLLLGRKLMRLWMESWSFEGWRRRGVGFGRCHVSML
jgi:hypothetical protein